MPYCKKHIKTPLQGYNSCAACEIEMLREDIRKHEEREKHCPTMQESESRALLRGIQEIASLVGIDNEKSSVRKTVEAVEKLVRQRG